MRISTLPLALILLTGVAVVQTGCETPETRIREKQTLFDSLKPADQELIKKGSAGLGFTPEMVKLALGDPDRVRVRTDASGKSEVWVYANYETTEGVYLYRGYYHRGYGMHGAYPFYLSDTTRRVRDSTRIVFSGGVVISLEEEKDR